MQDKIADLKKRKNIDLQQMAIELGMMQQDPRTQERGQDSNKPARKRTAKINKIETELNLQDQAGAGSIQMWAVLLPPILPLFLAGFVFLIRRVREREGVSRSRLK